MVNEGMVVTGAILLILGVVLFFIPFLCLVGLPLAIAGFVVLIAGIIAGGSQPAYYYPPPVVFAPAAQKDARKLESAGLRPKAEKLLEILSDEIERSRLAHPFRTVVRPFTNS